MVSRIESWAGKPAQSSARLTRSSLPLVLATNVCARRMELVEPRMLIEAAALVWSRGKSASVLATSFRPAFALRVGSVNE